MSGNSPGELEVYGYFSQHLGPRIMGAGLRIQFHYNQPPGIHFKVETTEEYREFILSGLRDGLAFRFPQFPSGGSVWITEVTEHPVDSSCRAFYLAARMVIDQAYAISETRKAEQARCSEPGDKALVPYRAPATRRE